MIRDTNFLDELYTDDELSDSIKDRDGKMKFLQKLIDCLSKLEWKNLDAIVDSDYRKFTKIKF